MSTTTPSPRRYSLFSKPLKGCVEPLLRPVFKAHGAAASEIIQQWDTIVGSALAAHTLPIGLSFPKNKNNQGTLSVACSGAHALELQHMTPLILERIASYFGYQAVSRMQIEQRPLTAKAPAKKAPPGRASGGLVVDTDVIAAVADDGLRDALTALAKSFLPPTIPPHSTH